MSDIPAWRRIMIALATGVVMKSDKKQWTARVHVLGVEPTTPVSDETLFIKADDEYDAARKAGEQFGFRLYGEKAATGFVKSVEGNNLFMVSVGLRSDRFNSPSYGNVLLRGRTLQILVMEYRP